MSLSKDLTDQLKEQMQANHPDDLGSARIR